MNFSFTSIWSETSIWSGIVYDHKNQSGRYTLYYEKLFNDNQLNFIKERPE